MSENLKNLDKNIITLNTLNNSNKEENVEDL